jgi:hypothetical protein
MDASSSACVRRHQAQALALPYEGWRIKPVGSLYF